MVRVIGGGGEVRETSLVGDYRTADYTKPRAVVREAYPELRAPCKIKIGVVLG